MFCPKGPPGQSGQKCLNNNSDCSHRRQERGAQMSTTYLNNLNNNPSGDEPLDRTPCGSATLSPHVDEQYDTPPHIRWSQDFHYLINDSDGYELFKSYLQNEGMGQMLEFWFACEGLKIAEDKEYQKLANIIYKRYIRHKTIDLSPNVRKALKQSDQRPPPDTDNGNCGQDSKYNKQAFDQAQHEVEEKLKGSIYTNFLRSDVYLSYLQTNPFLKTSGSYESTDSSKDSGSSATDDNPQSGQYYESHDYGVLATVDEESELQTTESLANKTTSNPHFRSQTQNKFQSTSVNPCHNLMSSGSNDTLLRGINKILSQRSADHVSPRLTTELHPQAPAPTQTHFRGKAAFQSYLRSKAMSNPPNPYHVNYATVLPNSARNSELQSISSHSTNDTMSSVSGQDGVDISARPKKHSLPFKHSAKFNTNCTTIPRPPKIPPPTANDASSDPDKFAQMLIDKLEALKKLRDSDESNDKKLKEALSLYTDPKKPNAGAHHQIDAESSSSRPKGLREVLKGGGNMFEFCQNENNAEEILDKHCAQVFSETPNETPTDSNPAPIRCASPPKQNHFRAYDHRMTPPVSAPLGSYDPTQQVNVTVKYSTESIPYRLALTGPHITLRKFKNQIPAKRGNWQYYFKRKCDQRELIDISAAFVLEKISDDNVLLPLIDGKIFAELQESN